MPENTLVREVLRHRHQECLVSVVDSEVASIRRADVSRTGVRIYSGESIGVAGALGEPDLEALTDQASAALSPGVPYPVEPGGAVSRKLEHRAELESHGDLITEVEAILDALRGEFPELIFSNQAGVTRDEVTLENDRGLDLSYRGSDVGLGLLFKKRGSPNLIDGMISSQGREYRREAFLGHARELLNAFRHPVALPAGQKLPVLFVGGHGLSMPLSFFSQALEGRSFGAGASPLASSRGEARYAPEFTLWQTRHPDDVAGAFFDREGVFAESFRVPLVEGGVVVGPYTDRRTAARHDLPLTGAASGPYDGVPSLGCPPLRAAPGEASLAEILDGTPGVLVLFAAGGEFTPTGEYATPVQLAFLHDGERLVGRLPELSVRGSDREMFGGDFLGVSSDTFPAVSGENLLVMRMAVEAGSA